MKLLLLDTEVTYYAGAQVVLQYYLEGLLRHGLSPTVGLVSGSPLDRRLPLRFPRLFLTDNQRFRLGGLLDQGSEVAAYCRKERPNCIHGWTARSWELAALAGMTVKLPAIGTLHDHPEAPFISGARQWLMRTCANHRLSQVCCVSRAVLQACLAAEYSRDKLMVAYNGLPGIPESLPERLAHTRITTPHVHSESVMGLDADTASSKQTAGATPVKLGFLGAFSRRKGIHGLLAVADALAQQTAQPESWEIHIAGDAQDAVGRSMVDELKQRYAGAVWWPRIHWHGWLDNPADFLRGLDILLLCSTEFDPLPTVILEAAAQGTPTLAADVGGVAELVQHGKTGWLYPPNDWETAARICAELIAQQSSLGDFGKNAWEHLREHFSVEQMVMRYLEVYAAVS